MDSLLLIITLASIHLGIVVIPGPNFLVIVKNSLTHSRRAGLVTARGVAIGTIVYVIAGFLGFTALLSQSVELFNIIKWLGTLYFIYVGIQLIRHANRDQTDITINTKATSIFTDRQAFRSGLLTMLSNVKSAFYFMFLFTTFLPSDISLELKLIVIVIVPMISLAWYTTLALTFSNNSVRGIYQRIERGMNIIFGAVWILLGVRLATTSQN